MSQPKNLILSRFPGESVIIKTSDGEIIITALGHSRQGIKLAFEAPKEIQIDREEIYQLKKNANNSGGSL